MSSSDRIVDKETTGVNKTARKAEPDTWAETIKTIVYAVLIAVVIRTFAFEPFNIPSESMLPTLMVGDYLFVSKYPYGYSRYSLPFGLPLIKGRIFAHPVARGDIVVFKLPADNRTDYIKRIVGIPGDRIQMIDSVLNINGQPVKREQVKDFVSRDRFGNYRRYAQYRETLPSGVSYMTLDMGLRPVDNTGVFVVPQGHYFAMGDNRDNSADSRVPNSGVGFIPDQNLVGRAEILFFSTDGTAAKWQFWRWISAARFGRFFKRLH